MNGGTLKAVTLDHNYNFEFIDHTVKSFIHFIGKHIFCWLNFRIPTYLFALSFCCKVILLHREVNLLQNIF